ncbi:anti-anti-sigma factor [Mycolicibacter senuensis]|nr:STAS domain-containing protein [Mycolicibacter senuensis]MDQ2627943.1 STAS domain-containing protein [Actinomycetota bacterium]ORW64493.1 anti-anti-sigma factor [Mycolicibacter senuensis]
MDGSMVECDDQADAVVVRAKGEIDSSNVDALATQLAAAVKLAMVQPCRPILVDLQQLTFFGSAALSALLDCRQAAAEAGTSLRVVAEDAVVVRPIQVTNLDQVLEIYPTLSAALRGAENQP